MKTKKINEGLGDLAHIAEMDHEVQMARADLYKIAKYAIKLHEMLKGVSEQEGLEGWVQSKITKASDYLDSVYHNLDYKMNFEEKNNPKTEPEIELSLESKQYLNTLNHKLTEKKKDPCWKDYKMVGTKKKKGKTVPNCVPK